MIVKPHELEIYHSCPARWKLLDRFPATIPAPTRYVHALRKTIFRMFSWLMSNNKRLSKKSTKDYWDQQWWVAGMKDKKSNKKKVFEKAAEGWLILDKFYDNFYKNVALPIGVNFDFTLKVGNLDVPIYLDLILADRDGTIKYVELGGRKTEWDLFNSVKTKLEVYGLSDTLQKPPAQKVHLDFVSRKGDYLEKSLTFTPDYLLRSNKTIEALARNIGDDVVYTIWSEACKTCPAAGKCWY